MLCTSTTRYQTSVEMIPLWACNQQEKQNMQLFKETPCRTFKCQRTRSTTCNFGALSPLDFLNFLQCIFFPFSPGFLWTKERKSPQNVEKIARFLGGEKRAESCHVSGCHGFFGPEYAPTLPCWIGAVSPPIISLREIAPRVGTPGDKCLRLMGTSVWRISTFPWRKSGEGFATKESLDGGNSALVMGF